MYSKYAVITISYSSYDSCPCGLFSRFLIIQGIHYSVSDEVTMNCDLEPLISAVQERPAIWDESQELYKDRVATGNAWREVCVILNEDFVSMTHAEKNHYGKLN